MVVSPILNNARVMGPKSKKRKLFNPEAPVMPYDDEVGVVVPEKVPLVRVSHFPEHESISKYVISRYCFIFEISPD